MLTLNDWQSCFHFMGRRGVKTICSLYEQFSNHLCCLKYFRIINSLPLQLTKLLTHLLHDKTSWLDDLFKLSGFRCIADVCLESQEWHSTESPSSAKVSWKIFLNEYLLRRNLIFPKSISHQDIRCRRFPSPRALAAGCTSMHTSPKSLAAP